MTTAADVQQTRWLGQLGLLLAAVLLLPVAVRADLDRPFFMRLAPSFVKVEAVDEGGGFSLGSGVTVAPATVVTNCHVTRGAVRVQLAKGGLRWPVTGQRADPVHDLCLLDAPGLDTPPVELGSAALLKLGQPVAAIGYTGGMDIQFRQGVVKGLHRMDGSRVIQSSTPFTSGASGGGLFDGEGRLVGILTFRLRGSRGSYYSTPVEWLGHWAGEQAAFVPVAPLKGEGPFWQRPLAALPFFMQAASLEAEQRWQDLLGLTERWAAADGDDAEAWFMRGKAFGWLDRIEGAARAFRRAVDIDPSFSQAWFDLGKAYLRLGRRGDLQGVREVLEGLDPELAQDLAAMGGLERH